MNSNIRQGALYLARQKRISEIMSSDKPLFTKIQLLAFEADFDYNIVWFTVINGRQIENILYSSKMRERCGITMAEFLRKYGCYFKALQACLDQCDKLDGDADVERFAEDMAEVRSAVSLWRELTALTKLPDSHSSYEQRRLFYDKANAFILNSASVLDEADYVQKQQTVLAEYYLSNFSDSLTPQEADLYKKLLAINDNA